MKRSVAIVGPTPMFLRWAIEHPCPLRDIYPDRLAESTFRQLRGLREISLALQHKRVHLGYCIHPHAKTSDADSLSGFSVDEVAGIFGGTEFIEDQCKACPANIGSEDQKNLWCGCYGGVSTDLRIDFQSLVRGEHLQGDGDDEWVNKTVELTTSATSERWDLPNLINKVVRENGLHGEVQGNFPPSRTAWFALWKAERFDKKKLALIEWVFRLAIDLLQKELDIGNNMPSKSDLIFSEDLKRFHLAIKLARDKGEKIVVELVPQGYSDGRTWQINPHCKSCRQTWKDRSRLCAECGESGLYQNEIKLKVLGLRPYVELAKVIGIKGAEKLIESFRSQFAEQ